MSLYLIVCRVRKCRNAADIGGTHAARSSQTSERICRRRAGIFRGFHENLRLHRQFSQVQEQGDYYVR